MMDGVVMDGLTIHLHDPCVDVPGWDRFDEVKQ